MMRRYSTPSAFDGGLEEAAGAVGDEVERLDDHAFAAGAGQGEPPLRGFLLAGFIGEIDEFGLGGDEDGIVRCERARSCMCHEWSLSKWTWPSEARRWREPGGGRRSSDGPAVAAVGGDVLIDHCFACGKGASGRRDQCRGKRKLGDCGIERADTCGCGGTDAGVLIADEALGFRGPGHEFASR